MIIDELYQKKETSELIQPEINWVQLKYNSHLCSLLE